MCYSIVLFIAYKMFLKITNSFCLLLLLLIGVSWSTFWLKNFIKTNTKLLTITQINGDQWSVKTTRDGIESYNNCVNNLDIPFDDVLKIEKINDPLNRLILKCVYVDIGFYTEGEGFHADRLVKQFGGGEIIEEIVKRCLPIDSDDPLDDQIIGVEECFRRERVGGYQD